MTVYHAIILAAGEGTRMRSSLPKILHPIAGWPMVRHVVEAVQTLPNSEVSIVIGTQAERVKNSIESFAPNATFFEQAERLGTAHAVLSAREKLESLESGVVLIVFGDTPLLTPDTLKKLAQHIEHGAAIAVLGFETAEPTGYGRLITAGNNLLEIVEEKDATALQKMIRLCNAGAMAVDARYAMELLTAVENKNAKNEYYLTDIVKIARKKGYNVTFVTGAAEEALGANTRVELAELERLFQQKKRVEMMLNGVTLIAPETVFFAADTTIEPDVTIEPNVLFGLGVHIATNSVIHAFSHIEGANIGSNVHIGPYARLRPGTVIHDSARIGNFVEVKNSHMHTGAKANHLSYIGDAIVGANANIGAGTITCNYDGFNKALTQIGEGAFIGSNTALVAPVNIGDRAIIGAGSVITQAVTDDAIAFTRAPQTQKHGAAIAFRDKRKK